MPAVGQCDCSAVPAVGQCDCSAGQQTTPLGAWLHITDRCNLRCDYCYLPHLPTDMSYETGCHVVDDTLYAALKHGYSQVYLKYAGGEPLLRFDMVERLHHYAQNAAREQGISLDGVVLSNGTLLTAEIITRLQALGLRLMISLDGLGTVHDCQRSYASGRGSAADVTRAVDLALAHGLVPDISIVVSGRNASHLPALLAWVLERDLPFSLNFYRENQRSRQQHDLALEEAQIIAGMLSAYRAIEANLPRRSLLASLVDRANLAVAHRYPCGVGKNYLVFDTQGRVAACQMCLDQAVARNAHSDPLTLVQHTTPGVQNISVEEKEGCRSCQWQYWCAGGCPLTTWDATGRYDQPSPNCAIYQALYPEVLRLEGLRVLKYGATEARTSSKE
jgi:uncharacterized protein